MSDDENPRLFIEKNDEGETIRIVSPGRAFAKDRSYTIADLTPSHLDLSEIRKKMQGGTDTATYKKLWEQLRDKPHSELKSIAEECEKRSEELMHRIHGETNAVEDGRLSEDQTFFSSDHIFYANYLTLKANVADEAMRCIRELGQVPPWGELPVSSDDHNELSGGDSAFKGTWVAYDHCTSIVDAYHDGGDSPRPMKQMGDLRRELGVTSDRIIKAGKRTITRAGRTYEKANLGDFVSTIEEILDDYTADR